MNSHLLAEAPRTGDPGAVAAIHDAHADGLFQHCWFMLGNQDVAQVALRDSLIVADAHRVRLAEPGLLRPWLYALARAECLRRRPSPAVQPYPDLPADPDPGLSAEPPAQPGGEPGADLPAEPGGESAVDLSAEPGADLSAGPATEPAAESGVDLAAEPAAEPAAERCEPAAGFASERRAGHGAGLTAERGSDARPGDRAAAAPRLIAWHAVMCLSPLEREALELSTRQGLPTAELAHVLGICARDAELLLLRARASLRRALAGEILARTGGHDCADRAAILAGWDGKLAAPVRERLARHADDGQECGQTRPHNVSVAKVYGLLPAPEPPPELRSRVLSCCTDPEFAGYRAFVAGRAAAFTDAGFP